MLERYRIYLTVERGLGRETARGYVDSMRHFLNGRVSPDGLALDLEHLSAADVISFVVARCPRQGRSAAKLTASALRSLLDFLHVSGLIERSLTSSVPSVASRRLAGLPKGLEPAQVLRLLKSCDNSTPNGRRDFAVLTMLVRLGLRASEVAKLRLEDIDCAGRRHRSARQGKLHRACPVAHGRRGRGCGVFESRSPFERRWPDGICSDQGASSRHYPRRGDTDRRRRRTTRRPWPNSCSSSAAYGGDADAACRRNAARDRSSSAPSARHDYSNLRQSGS